MKKCCAFLFLMMSNLAAGQTLFYGGDATGGWFNNSTDPDTTTQVLDDFNVPIGQHWHITGLFSNNVADYDMSIAPVSSASWSIRVGVAPGNPGAILYSGTSPVTIAPTGRSFAGKFEYRFLVTGLSIHLPSGTYFMSVSPIVERLAIYYVAESDGTNRVGSSSPGGYQEMSDIVDGKFEDSVVQVATAGGLTIGAIGNAIDDPVASPTMSGHILTLLVSLVAFFGIAAMRRRRP